MPKGISINIGVGQLNDDSYQLNFTDTFNNLKSASWDAKSMTDLAVNSDPSFDQLGSPYNNPKASDMINIIKAQENNLVKGDLLLLTFSGHGMKMPWDQVKGEIAGQPIPKDVAWCFHDGPLLDVELTEALSVFKEGVRILIVSDSCHSGSIVDLISLGINSVLAEKLKKENFDIDLFEAAVLQENGFNFIEVDKSILKKNIDLLNRNDIKTIRENNLIDLRKESFQSQFKDFLKDSFEGNGFPPKDVNLVLKNFGRQDWNKKLYFTMTNQKLNKLIKTDNSILDNLPTFDFKNLITDKIDLDDLKTIPLIENPRSIPKFLAKEIYKQNRISYLERRDASLSRISTLSQEKVILASVIVLSACQDDEQTKGGCSELENSSYIKALLATLKNTKFDENYKIYQKGIDELFEDSIRKNCDGIRYRHTQKPKLTPFNADKGNHPFISQKPFQI